MSNNKSNNSNSIYKDPVILGALITGVFAVIAALVTGGVMIFNSLLEKNKVLVDKPTAGEFQVDATDHDGTRFFNDYQSPQTYSFKASGEWTYNTKIKKYNKNLAENKQFPEKSPPGGYRDLKASENYYLPGSPEGALIVGRRDSNNKEYYEFVGNSREIKLKPKEEIFFTINDTNDETSGDTYGDNEGVLTVGWTCITCTK